MSSRSLWRTRRSASRSVVTCGSMLKTFSICISDRSRAREAVGGGAGVQLATRVEVELDRHRVPRDAERAIPALRGAQALLERGAEGGERHSRSRGRQRRERRTARDRVLVVRDARALLRRIGIAELDAIVRGHAVPPVPGDAIGGGWPAAVSSAARRMRESTYRVVPAVDKAARLLAELRDDEGLGISELARRIKASKGTVRDILLTLASHDLITRGADGRFRRGGQRFDLTHLARPHLDALLDAFGETAFLRIVTDGAVDIAPPADPGTDLHMSAPIGRRLPPHVRPHPNVLSGGADIRLADEEDLAGVRAVAAPIVDTHGRR